MAKHVRKRKNRDTLPERGTYSVPEAAARIGVGRNQAYEAARRGEIPVIRIGQRLLVPRAALDRLLGVDADDA